MKSLVTQYHPFNIKDFARRWWFYPFCKYDWVWRTHKGTHQTSATITTLKDSLQRVYRMDAQCVLQGIQLTYSIGPRGGTRPWCACPTCQRRVGMLYHVNGLPFRCRTCCELAYPSQYRSRDQNYSCQLLGLSHREWDRLMEQCAVGA